MEPIKISDTQKWDPKKETIKYARWNPIKTYDNLIGMMTLSSIYFVPHISKHLTNSNGTPKMKVLRTLDGTLSKHLLTLNGTPKSKLLRILDGSLSGPYQST